MYPDFPILFPGCLGKTVCSASFIFTEPFFKIFLLSGLDGSWLTGMAGFSVYTPRIEKATPVTRRGSQKEPLLFSIFTLRRQKEAPALSY